MDLKQQAAQKALQYIQSGMVVGLGTGSTTMHFLNLLGEQIRLGGLSGILGVPTSEHTSNLADQLGIPLTTLAEHPSLDVAVDGADEVDPDFRLIKGLGKALLREKLVEIHARQFIVIVDESKLVRRLGTRGALPVEIVRFEWQASVNWLNTLGCYAELWTDETGEPVVTDNGNFLARCWFGDREQPGGLTGIPDVERLARRLSDRPGIVEHGLFLQMATRVIVAGNTGITSLEYKL
jgi:ribose 5-phosphate isomerase A